MPPIFHFGRAIGQAVSRVFIPRHGAAHYARKLGPQAALVLGGVGGGVAVDTAVREILKKEEVPVHQEGEENASLNLEDRSWNLVKFTDVSETQETESGQVPSPHLGDSALHHHAQLFYRFRLAFMIMIASSSCI